jgi:hypothetical protein
VNFEFIITKFNSAAKSKEAVKLNYVYTALYRLKAVNFNICKTKKIS